MFYLPFMSNKMERLVLKVGVPTDGKAFKRRLVHSVAVTIMA